MALREKLGEPMVVTRIHLNLTAKQLEKLERLAKRAGKSVDDYVSAWVRRELR